MNGYNKCYNKTYGYAAGDRRAIAVGGQKTTLKTTQKTKDWTTERTADRNLRSIFSSANEARQWLGDELIVKFFRTPCQF
ncbi:hypothetical protein IKQ19_09155 [Candidatus Saccharibacteria bacterium]|nr:hypothetical protein [Candidatus Saccharibacteria bacterium]